MVRAARAIPWSLKNKVGQIRMIWILPELRVGVSVRGDLFEDGKRRCVAFNHRKVHLQRIRLRTVMVDVGHNSA